LTLSEAQISYIQSGGIIAYPTSTLPGLGCIPTSDGLDLLFELKSRTSDKPVSLGVASLDQVRDMVEIHPDIEVFLSEFPRGCFSVIYPCKETLDSRIGGNSVAIRVFDHPIARQLAETVGPITATSANEAGNEAALTVRDAAEKLGLEEIAILDGNRVTGPGSTFVKFDFSNPDSLVTVMREGVVPTRDVVSWWKNRR
jgi:L-threonylcarbamoyladenylate synthase